MAEKVSITGQVAEIKREIDLRKRVYPRQVAKGDMRQSEVDLCMRRIHAVLSTLMFCQEHEADIRAYIADKRAGA